MHQTNNISSIQLFSEFFHENQEKFLSFAYSYIRDRQEAEDKMCIRDSLRSDDFYCAGSHIQPFFPDGETPFLQWQFGTDDLAFLFSDYGSGFLSGQDSG